MTTSYNVKDGSSTYTYHDQVGPNNFRYYLGDGSPNNYQEIYVFLQVYISSKRWPTQNSQGYLDLAPEGSPYVKHVDGNNYTSISSEEWLIPLASRINSRDYYCMAPGEGTRSPCAYKGHITGPFDTYRYQNTDLERIMYITNINSPSKKCG